MKMNGMRNNASSCVALVLLLSSFVLLCFLPRVQCADSDGSLASFYTEEIYKELEGLTTALTRDIQGELGFCIKDVCVIYVHIVAFSYI